MGFRRLENVCVLFNNVFGISEVILNFGFDKFLSKLASLVTICFFFSNHNIYFYFDEE